MWKVRSFILVSFSVYLGLDADKNFETLELPPDEQSFVFLILCRLKKKHFLKVLFIKILYRLLRR